MHTAHTPRLTLVCPQSHGHTQHALVRCHVSPFSVLSPLPTADSIDEALEHIERLCYQLNEKQRTCEQETERVAALHRVAQRLDPQLKDLAASPTRQFKTELDVRLVNSRRGIVQERHMFVFTDTVILAKRNKLHSDHYHLKEQFALLPPCDLVDITAPYGLSSPFSPLPFRVLDVVFFTPAVFRPLTFVYFQLQQLRDVWSRARPCSRSARAPPCSRCSSATPSSVPRCTSSSRTARRTSSCSARRLTKTAAAFLPLFHVVSPQLFPDFRVTVSFLLPLFPLSFLISLICSRTRRQQPWETRPLHRRRCHCRTWAAPPPSRSRPRHSSNSSTRSRALPQRRHCSRPQPPRHHRAAASRPPTPCVCRRCALCTRS